MDITEEAMIWADSVVNSMTLEEQAAQLLMPAVYARSDEESMRRIRWYADSLKVGGLLLLQGDVESAASIADTLETIRRKSPLKTGYFLSVDAETGLGMRFSDAPQFPWNHDIPADVADQTFFDYGSEVGREAQLTGINMILGPVVDIDRGRGVMKMRSLGSDQGRVADLSLAYAKGLESRGVISVAKHFPGHGPTTTDSHTGLPKIQTSREELYNVDLLPFRSMIANGLSGVMVGHIWVEAIDSVKRPASFSPRIMKRLLRHEMGFKGLVLVDAIGMGGAKGYNTADAVQAGADLIIAPEDTMAALVEIVGAVKTGRIRHDEIKERCRRVLFYKYLFNIPFNSRKSHEQGASSQLKERLLEEALPIIDSLS